MTKYLTGIYYHYCSRCGAEWKMSIEQNDNNFKFVVCNECLAAAVVGHSPLEAGEWNKQWENYNSNFIKKLYKTTTDENIKSKIMLKLLASKNKSE